MNPADSTSHNLADVVHDPVGRADLFDAFPTLVWLADGAGGCSFVNQAWQDYTGRTLGDALGMGWLASVHPEDHDGVERDWRQAQGLRQPLAVQYRLRRADASFGWVHHAAQPVSDAQGRLAGYVGTCNDITEQRVAELEALAKEQQMRVLADNVPVHIAWFDARELKCLFANKAYARMWGWDEQSIVGRTVREVIGEEAYREIVPYIERTRRGETVVYERTVKAADGGTRVLEVSLMPQCEDSGVTRAAFVLIHDITRYRDAERSVRESEERLRKFAEAAQAGIVFHEDGIVTDCNDAILRLSGFKAEELIGSQIISHVAPALREEAAAHVRSGYERPYESQILHKDGSLIPVELEGRTMPFNGKEYRLSVVRDIRRRKASQARIDYLAHHDLLTGLPNRALLLDRLEFILATARRREAQVGLLFIDLDNFKAVNDSLGHMAGDALLRIIAERVQKALRSVDVVSRHGGDEFLVVLPDLDDEHGPIPVADKLLATISEPTELEGQVISVSPSIGIAVFPRDGDSAEELIRNSDAAMYLAKERGRSNYQFFNASLSLAALRALTLETRMREALREEAFVVHYQPQVRVDDGALIGIEALVRWPQADGGFIEPEEFIPVAEQRGLIRAIGSWVLRQACRQNREWQSTGLPKVPVAVNLSPVQFRQKSLLTEVREVLAETGLAPQYLAFELTEGMLVDDTGEMVRTLEGLKGLGVKLAIDDFGTGHSSLVHLKRFPIDKLKIDRAFVRDTPDSPDDCAIAAAIIDLARNMGLTSIAEGVARQEQLDFLRSRGCQEAQGPLFADPLPPEEMSAWLARPRAAAFTSAPAA